MNTRLKILSMLADGNFHSGTELGSQIGISRAAVNKTIQGLVDRGLDIHSISGKGYRWASPSRLLDRELLARRLGPEIGEHDLVLTILDEVDSTSSYLADRLKENSWRPEICLAENQTGGRGRRGRSWLATPYQNLVLSISWRYQSGPSLLSGLSIAAGIAIARALQASGVEGAQLKWPNDVLHRGRKLAGVLVDIKGEADGPTDIVLGVGLNLKMGAAAAEHVDQPWVDLETIMDRAIDRNDLAANLVRELVTMMASFAASGLQPYLHEWQKWHAFENKSVRLVQADREVRGTVCGIDASGALQINTGEQVLSIHSGEVSLRAG